LRKKSVVTDRFLQDGQLPVGGAKNLKLDKHADKIDSYLGKGINKVAIAKLLDVSPNTLYEWLKVRRPDSTPAP
jgi:hypothetical protein